MISTNDFRPGVSIEFRNGVWQVLEAMHVKPGKGSAFVQTRLRNLSTGEVLRVNFRAGERLPQAPVERIQAAYLYREGAIYYLMDEAEGEFIELTAAHLGDNIELLIEGLTGISVLKHKDRILSVDLPIVVELRVVSTPPDERGDTNSGGGKSAILETGAIVTVPFHIKVGDSVRVDTRTRQYLSRS